MKNHKGLILFSLFIFSFSITCYCHSQVTKKYNLPQSFTGVNINCNAIVKIKKGNHNELRITGNVPATLDKMHIAVKNNILSIEAKHNVKRNWTFVGDGFGKNGIVVMITMKKINNIISADDSRIKISDNLQTDNITIKSFGSAHITINHLECNNFKANIYGSGHVEIKKLIGKRSVDLTLYGSSLFYSNELKTEVAQFTVTGSGTANIKGSSIINLNVLATDSSTLSLEGRGKVANITAEGSGRFFGGLFQCDSAALIAIGASDVEIYIKREVSVAKVLGNSVLNIDGTPKVKKQNILGTGTIILENSEF